MSNLAVSVTQALTRHAVRLLGFADLKMLLVVEDPNGNRIWSANGKLRSEFINKGQIENRSWGMIELETVGIESEEESSSLGVLKKEHRDSSRQRDSVENIDRSSSLERGVENELSTKSRDLPSKYFDYEGERSMAGSGLPQSAGDVMGLSMCMHCGKPHSSLNCPLVNPCAGCGELGHEIVHCMKAAPVADVDKAFCDRCGLTGHIAQFCLSTSCFKCGRADHLAPQCGGEGVEMALGQNGMVAGMPNMNGCSKCGGRDHNWLNCVICFKCKRHGHMAPKCPNCLVCSKPGHDPSKCPACPLCLMTDHKVVNCPKNTTGITSVVICHKCFKAGHKATECAAVICHKCGEPGHKSPECPHIICFRCKKVGHIAPDCPESRLVCHKCKAVGHKAPDCPQNTCHNCFAKGHIAPECPVVICHKCKGAGHKATECPADLECSNCGQKGHKSAACVACSKCHALGHKTENCPAKTCHKCGVIGHIAPDCPQKAKSNTPKTDAVKPNNPKLSSACPECGRAGHTIMTCPISIIKKMKSTRDAEKANSQSTDPKSAAPDAKSSSQQMGTSNNDSDDDVEIVDAVGGADGKRSSGSQKKSSAKMDMKLASMLRYKDRARLYDRLMGLCETKIKTGDKGNYTEIYDVLKELIDSADKMEIPESLMSSCRTFRDKLKSCLQKIRVDSWKKGNIGVGLFIHSELTGLVPKSMLPRGHLGKSGPVKNPSLIHTPSPAKPESRPEARAFVTGGNQVTLESLLDRPNMKDQREALLRLIKTCHIRSEGNDTGGYLAIFDIFKDAISLLKPSKVDSDIRPAFEIFVQKLENLKQVARENAAKKGSGTAAMIHRNLLTIVTQPVNNVSYTSNRR